MPRRSITCIGDLASSKVARYLVNVNDLAPKRTDKFRTYRARKRAAGLREIRMWVPDVNAPGFWEESVRQAKLLRDAPEEEETMRFVEALRAEDGDWD